MLDPRTGIMPAGNEQSLSEYVYQEIRQRICDLRYAPGCFLSEARLAAEYHVSKMPIKLAVRRLENDGWLIADFRRKIRVKPICEQDIRELYQLRELLEREALHLIFTAGRTWEYSFRLEEKLLRIKAARDDIFQREQAECDWHAETITIYDSAMIDRIYANLRDEAVRTAFFYMQRLQAHGDYISDIIHGLEQIVHAIREQDESTACAILERDHWQGALQLALEALAASSLPDTNDSANHTANDIATR